MWHLKGNLVLRVVCVFLSFLGNDSLVSLSTAFEFCSMTGGAQQALRRTMEIYSNTTRFALACNLSSKIIEPIQSRCAVVRFARLTELEILDRLLRVVEAEKVSLGNLSSDSFIDVVESFLLNQLFLCVAQAGS